MAAKKDTKLKMPPPPAGKPRTPFVVWLTAVMGLATAAIFLPTTIIFTVGLIPTLVAAIVDAHPRKTAWLTVGAMNLAGTVPVWIAMIDAGNNIGAAFQTILQPTQILIAYGGAGIGWMIYHNVPPLIAAMQINRAEKRVRDIDRRLSELVRKWGENVILK